jgi:hypothetical protein
VTEGDSQQRVRELLGQPYKITDGTKGLVPDALRKNRSDIVEDYWYVCIYAPHALQVSFNKDKKVVVKREYISW